MLIIVLSHTKSFIAYTKNSGGLVHLGS